MNSSSNNIVLGTAQFGLDYGISNKNGKPSRLIIERILNEAYSQNIQYLDTASSYGDAENLIGQFNQGRFEIISKFMPEKDEGLLEEQLHKSLNNLQTNKIYAYLAHRPTEIIKNPKIWENLIKFKKKGLVDKIGVSFDNHEEYTQISNLKIQLDIAQMPFNYFDNRFEQAALNLKSSGCEIHSRSTYLQGLFFIKSNKLSPFFSSVKHILKELQLNYGDELKLVLLKYVLNLPYVDKVVLGVENDKQLRENLKKSHFNLDEKLTVEIEKKIIQPSKWKI